MATFILKTEPTAYSFDDLVREKRCVWTGVRNPAAIAHIRAMRKGDEAFIYHTGDEKSIVGLAKVVSEPYADPDQPGATATGEPKFAVVDLAPVKKAATPVTLAQVKADKRFATFPLVTQGRLSVMPVPAELNSVLRKLSGL